MASAIRQSPLVLRDEREPPRRSGIIFRGRDLGAQVGDAIIDGTLERTIEGASTLTLVIHDRERALPHTDLFSSAVEIQLDEMYFTLTGGTKNGHDFTYTFEESEIARMRLDRGFLSADRAKVNRPQFVAQMIAEATLHSEPIPFICPELDDQHPITSSRTNPHHHQVAVTAGARALRRRHRKPGVFLNPSHFTIRGAPATPYELHNLEVVMDVCAAINAPPNAFRAAVMVPLEEDQARNSTVMLDHTSIGMYQILTSTAQAAGIQNRNDIAACCHAFLTRGFTGKGGAIALARKGLSPGEIGTAVQGGITQPAQYAPYLREADRIIAAYHGGLLPTGVGSDPGGLTSATTSFTRIKRYSFTRGQAGKREDTWTAGLRLAQEVGRRFFVVSGAVYYISEEDLFASEAVAEIDEHTDGIDNIDYDWHPRKRASTLTVTAHIGRWKVPPGAVFDVPKGTFGEQVDGRWLVSTISRPLFRELATITCKQPSKELPEPPNPTEQVSVSVPSRAGLTTIRGGVIAGTRGHVVLVPGANRAGVSLQPPILEFLALGAGVLHKTIYISTGTNHNQFVAGTSRQSDHWEGNAADLGSVANHFVIGGVGGGQIATALLIVTGMSAAQATAWGQEGTDRHPGMFALSWHGHRVQVLWKTAAHYDHVHCGVA